MSNRIFVALSSFAEHDQRPLQLLERSGFPFTLHKSGKRITKNELLAHAKDAKVILAGVEVYDSSLLAELKHLRCISRCGVGTDSIDMQYAKLHEICVTNTPGIPNDAVAELALAMFLALSRDLFRQAQSMREMRWERRKAHLLSGRTIGIIGYGNIGRRVAQLCLAFNARVVIFDPLVNFNDPLSGNVSFVDLDTLLKEADIVSLHASKLSKTPFLMGHREFGLMKLGSFLVNLARGDMVDEQALIEALSSGHLSGAGLDVYQNEPYKGKLCEFDQVILSPHSATNTIETRSEMELMCVENALEFLGHQR